jgi:RHS repeat-associated protein
MPQRRRGGMPRVEFRRNNRTNVIVGRHNSGAPTGSQDLSPYPDRNVKTSVVTGDGGVILESYRYDAFGQPTIYGPDNNLLLATAIANKFLYTGREWNPEYKFYEYRARAYNPALGRFMTQDP